jgi:hypothetical protein
VRFASGVNVANRLSFASSVTIDASDNVKLGSTTIGKRTSNGFATNELIVVFNVNATVSRVRDLVRAVTFKYVGEFAGSRSIQFTVSDGDGGVSDPATGTRGVNVVAVNDRPALALGGTISYQRNAAAILLAPTAVVTDADSANFAGGILRVSIGTGDSSTNRLSIGGSFTIDANNNVKLGDLTIGKRTSNGFGTNDLQINLYANATLARVQQLLRSISFKTVEGAAGTRSIQFSLSDGDGGTSPLTAKSVSVS